MSASEDKTVKIWNIEAKEEIFTFVGHQDFVSSIALNINGALIATAGWDR